MLDRKKLARLCEMFRSDSDQERATAARLATVLVQSAGLTWTNLIVGHASSPPGVYRPQPARSTTPPPPRPDFTRTEVRDGVRASVLAKELLAHSFRLTSWEAKCVECIVAFGPYVGLTEVQWRLMEVMARRAGAWELAQQKSAHWVKPRKRTRWPPRRGPSRQTKM